MKLPKKQLQENSSDHFEIESILIKSEQVLRTWKSSWTLFVSERLRVEVIKLLSPVNGLNLYTDGGYQGAERQRILLTPYLKENLEQKEISPIKGIRIQGNFLFHKPTPQELRIVLESMGASTGELGDIWIQSERFAQVFCTPEISEKLSGQQSTLKDIPIRLESISSESLKTPSIRLPKKITTFESSKRIDSIASAGFGLSRAKIAKQIKDGQLRLNWTYISQTSKEVETGDLIRLENKGSLEIINIELTKRNRWRVELLRK